MRVPFHAGACLDLGAFDPTLADCGVDAHVERAQRTLSWVVLMEDRQPVWFHGYQGYDPAAPVPLNRHGPNKHAWTQADVKRLVEAFHAHDVKVLLGYWTHECSFVDDHHPELLIRDATGALWQDRVEMNADFSPLRRMRADPAHDVRDNEPYATWSARRYARLANDFGFDGLFLGDGAMGFRRHGHDWKDLRHYDYHEAWIAEFAADHAFDHHDGCALATDAPTPAQAADIQAHHWDHWIAFHVERWTAYYRTMATAIHATGGILAAYNVMNYDPALARLHGIDYREIAEAGLDILVFQTYDYAWGPHGPFGFLPITRKDLETNTATLLRTRAHVGYDTPMQIVITVETEDEVETWDAPTAHTIGELYAYGHAAAHDGARWRRAADGAFIVWGNSVAAPEWRVLQNAFHALAAPPPEPHTIHAWDPDEIHRTTARPPTATSPDDLYAHLDASVGATAIVTRAPNPPAARRAKTATGAEVSLGG